MTLKELKKRVPVADKNGSVLGKTELLNSGAKIVVKEMVDTGVEISVFDNGYVLFEEDKHKTIFRLHSCNSYGTVYNDAAGNKLCSRSTVRRNTSAI